MIENRRYTACRRWSLVGFAFLTALGFREPDLIAQGTRPKYPAARRGDQVDQYFGVKVADPYRWLEDPDSHETRAWIKAQNDVTLGYLKAIPQRPLIAKRLTKLWNFKKFDVPCKRGGRYLLARNSGLQNQNVLYTLTTLDGEPRELLDPNTLSADGTVSLTAYQPSEDGKLLAYGLAAAGSDWQQWKVRDVETGKDLDDVVRWVKFSIASWAHDGSGFYYSGYDEPDESTKLTGINYYQKLFFHKLGTPQTQDRLIYHRPDEKEWGFEGQVTEDGRYLIVHVRRGTERKNQIFYLDLAEPNGKMVELITGWDAQYDFIGNDGPTFWFMTDHQAPRYRLIAVDARKPDRAQWREVIPEAQSVLRWVNVAGERFLANYHQDASTVEKIFELNGKPLGELSLPGIGTAANFSGRRSDNECFYSFTSFTVPTTIYRYDVASDQSSIFRAPRVDFRAKDYETTQVVCASRDGTKVPMFITARKGIPRDGGNPTLLYGYGGFNIAPTPLFSVSRAVWLEMGGVLAMPSLRGGGEYGRAWHEAGMKQRKQNVFDDFIAAAEYLVDQKYTSPRRLAISGRSNGGLLVGACLTQRPDLFGAALPGVGVMDMLRFQKFTIGWAWVSEYGSSDNRDDFSSLYKYSPLHRIKPGTAYPPTLITTADHDDRVVPAHSFKFAAALQAAQFGPAPVLIRIETSAGHGAGTPTSKLLEESTDSFAFLVKELGMKLPENW